MNLEWHGHEVWSELCNSPYNDEAFQLSGGVGFLRLVKGARCTADDALLSFTDLSEDRAEACSRPVRIQTEGYAEFGEGSDGPSGEERFEAVESVLAFGAPVEDRVFPGQGMQRAGDACTIF